MPPTEGLWEQTKGIFEAMLGNEIARVYENTPQIAEEVVSDSIAHNVERTEIVARVLDGFKHSLETLSFGTVLAALLKGLNLTGKDLAEKATIDQSYISRLVNGEVKPNVTTANKIIRALEVHGTSAADVLLVSAGHYPIYYRNTAIYLALNPNLRDQLTQAMGANG